MSLAWPKRRIAAYLLLAIWICSLVACAVLGASWLLWIAALCLPPATLVAVSLAAEAKDERTSRTRWD